MVKNGGNKWSDTEQKGVKIEAGYDFNRVIGLDVSYETANETLNNMTNDRDIEGSAIKAGADVGYAFYSRKAFLKPYAKIGFVSFSEDDYDASSVFAGLGLRYQYGHYYMDLAADGYFLDNDENAALDYYQFVYAAFTVGYKF
jgi:hypothetical protein